MVGPDRNSQGIHVATLRGLSIQICTPYGQQALVQPALLSGHSDRCRQRRVGEALSSAAVPLAGEGLSTDQQGAHRIALGDAAEIGLQQRLQEACDIGVGWVS